MNNTHVITPEGYAAVTVAGTLFGGWVSYLQTPVIASPAVFLAAVGVSLAWQGVAGRERKAVLPTVFAVLTLVTYFGVVATKSDPTFLIYLNAGVVGILSASTMNCWLTKRRENATESETEGEPQGTVAATEQG